MSEPKQVEDWVPRRARQGSASFNVPMMLASGGILLIASWLAGAPAAVYAIAGCICLLASYAVAIRSRLSLTRVTATTHKLEGFSARLSASFDAVPEPIVIVDARALVVFANAAARASLPNCKENNPLSFALRAPPVLNAVDSVLRDGHPTSVEYHERVPVERFFEVTVAPIARSGGDAGEPQRESVVILLRDITQLQRMQNMRVDFVANASHELRTPLASVIGFIETLQGPARNDVAARERFLGIMGEQARRMSRLVDDLLSLSRIELTQHMPPSGRVDVNTVVSVIVDTLAGLARDRGVVIEVAGLDVSAPATVLGDRDDLLRVFENLIENAIKYGRNGKRVRIDLDRQPTLRGEEIQVSIEDFGPGIAPEHVPRLTERFYRVDVGVSQEHGGTGLGLAIVKHILARHRGRLGIESRLGEGSKFTVVLPIAEDGEAPLR